MYLFVYFWLCCVFIAGLRLSLYLRWGGLVFVLERGLQLLQHTASVVALHRLSGSAACGIFPDQGLNPCPLLRQLNFYPLCRQGSPLRNFLILYFFVVLFLKAWSVCWKHLPRLAGEFWNSTGELRITASPDSVENSKAYHLVYQSWQWFLCVCMYIYIYISLYK